jgi:uncharacterized repeat protein (TIGR03803 family)
MSTYSNRDWVSMLIATILITLAAQLSQAQIKGLVDFDGTNGALPSAGLVQGLDGSLYGTTNQGGDSDFGTVFKMTATGSLTTLYNFCSQPNCTDGAVPWGLTLATDGNLYGTTWEGGANDTTCSIGCGTVFKIGSGGALTTLYSFCAQPNCADGTEPYGAGLVQGADGNLYGTTSYGGAHGGGTVFKITTHGELTVLYSFCSQSACADGDFPIGSLIQGTEGNLYGSTEGGGTEGVGDGTAFKVTTSGELTTLHDFCSQTNCVDGKFPNAGLIQGADGSLYGTTEEGGTESDPYCEYGCGTVFKISTTGALTTLHAFCASGGGCADGQYPQAGLVQTANGTLYGTTTSGGSSSACTFGCGVVFAISTSGEVGPTYSFDGTNGSDPFANVAQATSGVLYGTASRGGTDSDGTVFALDLGLGPFVETLPTSGKAGSTVVILGTGLTGATAVTFNGTAATFKVVSPSEISVTVPSQATSGTVRVTTPSGALSSNVTFRVEP